MTDTVALSGSTERGNPTEHNLQLRVGTLLVTRPASVVPSLSARFTEHKSIRRFGHRVEPAAPSPVVTPTRSRLAAAAPELDPPRFLVARNPGALDAALLVERDHIAHSAAVYTAGGGA